MKHDEALAEAARALGLALPDEALDRLAAFERLLAERAVPIGLVAGSDLTSLRSRHLLDCLRAAPVAPAGLLADLGSGAGLPGVIVAIARSDTTVHLVEAQRRRLAFLELAVERLGLTNAVPIGARVQELEDRYDGALARAFAGPVSSWSAASGLLGPAGRLVYFAGARFRPAELERQPVRIEIVPAPSLLASAGPLVIMSRQ